MSACENCGLPEWSVDDQGFDVKITVKAENKFKRASTKTVWCHSEECAVQTLAIAKYGPASSKWPVSLSQFRTLNRAAVTEMARQNTDSKDSSGRLFSKPDLRDAPGVFVTKKGGRPKKENALSGAERMRAYRAKQANGQPYERGKR